MDEKNSTHPDDMHIITGGSVDSHQDILFNYHANNIDLKSFSKHTRISEGGFGVIYKIINDTNHKEFIAKISKREILVTITKGISMYSIFLVK